MATNRTRMTAIAWMPTEQQRRVAELLATGYSQNRAATLTGVPQRTISTWWDETSFSEDFQKLVSDIAQQFADTQVLDQSVQLAELLFHQAMTGERNIDDPDVLLARELLAATSWKLYGGGHKQFGPGVTPR